MNVGIFTVIRQGTSALPTPRETLVNLNRLRNPSRISDFVTQFLYDGSSGSYAVPQVGWQVSENFETIQASLAGTISPNANILLNGSNIPAYINDVANTVPVTINLLDLAYGIVDATNTANVLLFVTNPNNPLRPFKYQFNTITLNALMVLLNGQTTNQAFTGAFSTATANTQAFTYDINLAVTLQLQVNKGEGWIALDNKAVSAGTGTATFAFESGDLVLNDAVRVVAILASGVVQPVADGLFANAGGSASGSGAPGDCTMYAYFDGAVWDDTDKTINVGNTCSVGYHIQISTGSDFTDTSKMVRDFNTLENITQILDLAAGSYYTRVQNLSGQTAYSSTRTFTNS